ncbi:hypothetical protein GTU54_27730, partial [Klebsiella pneumoniae]|nr:hypothetical protein [Klebsiella pneumoniae]
MAEGGDGGQAAGGGGGVGADGSLRGWGRSGRRRGRRGWWKAVEGVGRTGARQVEAVLAAHPQVTEGARALIPIIQPSGIVAWGQLRRPNEVDGAQGNFRAPRNACTLNATNDYEAVQAWLALHETVAT